MQGGKGACGQGPREVVTVSDQAESREGKGGFSDHWPEDRTGQQQTPSRHFLPLTSHQTLSTCHVAGSREIQNRQKGKTKGLESKTKRAATPGTEGLDGFVDEESALVGMALDCAPTLHKIYLDLSQYSW